MKLIITLEPKQINNARFKIIHPNEIDKIEDSSCLECHITCLDYLNNTFDFMHKCIQKLRNQGKLTLIGLDIIEISKQLISGRLSIEEVNKLLYQGKQSIDNLFRVKLFLLSSKMTIEDIRLNNIIYNITAIKNDSSN